MALPEEARHRHQGWSIDRDSCEIDLDELDT